MHRLSLHSLVVVLLSIPLMGSTISYDPMFNLPPSPPSRVNGNCGIEQPCLPYTTWIPQFDPSLGTLNSVDWTFHDSQSIQLNINNTDAPLGTPFTYTLTGGDQNSVLGINAVSSQPQSGYVTNPEMWAGTFGGGAELTSSGSVADMNTFTGTGAVVLSFQPSASISGQSADNNIYFCILGVQDDMRLFLTYDYTPVDPPADPAPEPAYSAVVLVLGLLGLVVIKRRTSSALTRASRK